ncbi:H(+)/Cl(-) exchange transporter ClcA [Methylocystis sp. MJC1]|jgi:CIC family chloride channel protein|uniref:H(+)/Cl(-) exchange transporter ClcA n=1 Tax=Methylocystis sp. MJC1 TaxID=2654282 RepID=UPI0013EA1744|nr:H(+)/Cl(-) exchange transporter ClcA [Methylocystis sp. MJC1]MBU6527665.1 H(+)/Cl(-) exchange transporter ClcA [Methylocystis sp. MJC1]UZX10602.1 H(+)/Cl(-) exchange transporter ClcA [Methylocystis sp. MJC1]
MNMRAEVESEVAAESGHMSLFFLSVLALLVGGLAGLVGAMFRLALMAADRLRDAIIQWAEGGAVVGFLVVVGLCAIAALISVWMVRRFAPHASGSGIPHVEAVLHGEAAPAPFILLPVKFFGGCLAIGAGLALGREGPSVQMGAVIGHLTGDAFRRSKADNCALLAAGAGAGLATAFNAPMAGAVFVLEELTQKFDQRVAIAALAASSTAIAVAHLLLGDAPDFTIPKLAYPAASIGPLFFILGAVMGLFGVVYNRVLLATLSAVERLRLSPENKAAMIGAMVGALAWFAPGLVGGGDAFTQVAISGSQDVFFLPFVLALRFALGAGSYSSGTPGGIFAPLLALGALAGLFFGVVCGLLLPGLDIQPQAFAIVGMTALFTAVVRAPLTGIVLVTEMTGAVFLLLPMLAACFLAMLAPTLLNDPPIYHSLRERLIERERVREQG